jgi:hypothetical protein
MFFTFFTIILFWHQSIPPASHSLSSALNHEKTTALWFREARRCPRAPPGAPKYLIPLVFDKSEGGQVFPAIDFPQNSIYLSAICNRFAKGGVNHILLEEEVERWAGNFLYSG